MKADSRLEEDNITAAACFSDGINFSPGYRRKQWAVIAPHGGTISLGSGIVVNSTENNIWYGGL
jgi:hypothetical protein